MFEKQAEEYLQEKLEERKDKFVFELPKVYIEDVKQSFRDGAEFGYNKANEWHKVKDEGIPKNKNDCALYLLYTIYGEGGSPVVAHFVYKDKQELMNIWTGAILTKDKIVAWKEIVLPKESE